MLFCPCVDAESHFRYTRESQAHAANGIGNAECSICLKTPNAAWPGTPPKGKSGSKKTISLDAPGAAC